VTAVLHTTHLLGIDVSRCTVVLSQQLRISTDTVRLPPTCVLFSVSSQTFLGGANLIGTGLVPQELEARGCVIAEAKFF
jgi:hypothetical protein